MLRPLEYKVPAKMRKTDEVEPISLRRVFGRHKRHFNFLVPAKCQAFTRTLFGDRPAGLNVWPILTKSHLAVPYGLIQLRLCPISLHLCKMCEFYATCKSLKLAFEVSIDVIQNAKREVTNEC